MNISKTLHGKMQYYVVRILTGKEKKFLSWIRHSLHENDVRIIWPRRCLSVRKAGVVKEIISSLYPGYIFLETKYLTDHMIITLRNAPGFVRFLINDYDIIPLGDRDKELFLELISYGEIIEKSQVIFDDNNRIRVVDGPLKQLEGSIIKVDRRKCRAKVRLYLHGINCLVDLGFEVMERIAETV